MNPIRLTGISDEITLESKDEIFANTKFKDYDFVIYLDIGFESLVDASIKANREAKTKLNQDDEMFGSVANAFVASKWSTLCAIQDWEGFEDYDGNPMECNDENKLKFFKEYRVYGELFEAIAKVIEAAKKPTKEDEAIEEGLGEPQVGSDGSIAQVVEEQV